MSTKCTAPVTGRHESADTESRCPACGPKVRAPGAGPKHMTTPPPPPAQVPPLARVEAVANATYGDNRALLEKVYEARSAMFAHDIHRVSRMASALCPSTRRLAWAYANANDGEPYLIDLIAHCEHGTTGWDEGGYGGDAHTEDGAIDEIEKYLPFPGNSPNEGIDTNVAHPSGFSVTWGGVDDGGDEDDEDNFFAPEGVFDDAQVLSIDVAQDRIAELGIDPNNNDAVEMVRGMKWWTFTSESPELSLVKHIHPDLRE